MQSTSNLLTADGFIDLLKEWTERHLDDINAGWAAAFQEPDLGRGAAGWELWLQQELRNYVRKTYPKYDLGGPVKLYVKHGGGKSDEQCDFLLNSQTAAKVERAEGDNVVVDQVATNRQKVIVELKAQSLGRLTDFRSDFRKVVGKLGRVAPQYAEADRLAVAFVFTVDVARESEDPRSAIPDVAAKHFVALLNEYDRMYFGRVTGDDGSVRTMVERRTPGSATSEKELQQFAKFVAAREKAVAEAEKSGKKLPPPPDFRFVGYEVGFIWVKNPPPAPPAEASGSRKRKAQEQPEQETADKSPRLEQSLDDQP